MEELKYEQEMRERRNQDREQWHDRHTENSAPSSQFYELPDGFDPSGRPGSFDDGDPQTTKHYVGNLSPQIWPHCKCKNYVAKDRRRKKAVEELWFCSSHE